MYANNFKSIFLENISAEVYAEAYSETCQASKMERFSQNALS